MKTKIETDKTIPFRIHASLHDALKKRASAEGRTIQAEAEFIIKRALRRELR